MKWKFLLAVLAVLALLPVSIADARPLDKSYSCLDPSVRREIGSLWSLECAYNEYSGHELFVVVDVDMVAGQLHPAEVDGSLNIEYVRVIAGNGRYAWVPHATYQDMYGNTFQVVRYTLDGR